MPTASSAEAAYLVAVQNFLINTGTFAVGSVILGYKPSDITAKIAAGPVALVRWENMALINQGGESAFYGTVDIVVDFVWRVDWKQGQTYIDEANWLGKIYNKIAGIGIPVDPNFGGHILSAVAGDTIAPDPNDRGMRSQELTITVAYGHYGRTMP